MILEKIYLKSVSNFGRSEFGIAQFSNINHLSYQSSKVLLHRLKNTNQVIKLGHGRYVLMPPKQWFTLQSLKHNQKLYDLVIELYRMFPNLSLLLLYGSQVRGYADRYSDYDVLIILPDSGVDTGTAKNSLEQKLKLKLHLTIYSEAAFKIFAITEPGLKFWFNDGIIFDEKQLLMNLTKPVARLGYLELLSEAKTNLNLISCELVLKKKTKYAFSALRISLIIENALKLNYDYSIVRSTLIDLLRNSFVKIRSGKPLSLTEQRKLELIALRTFKHSEKLAMGLGENESDIYWRGSLHHESQERT